MQQIVSKTPPLPDEIKKAAHERRLIIFLGAGISSDVKLPLWNKVKSDLIDQAKLPPNYNEQLKNMETYACFERIRREDPGTYNRIIESALSCEHADLDKFKKLLQALRSLKPVSIVTTNVDDLLFDCGVFRTHQFRYMDACAPQELRGDKVFFLHRALDRSQEGGMIFNTRDKMMYNSFFKNFLNNVFGSYCVLFVGFSFRDTDLLKYATLNPKFGDSNNDFRGHVALLPSDHNEPPFLELEQEYGIHVLEYENADGTYRNFAPTILSWDKSQTSRSVI